ncbi:hypothetical protein BDV93DRAFT_511277 [Ceratobasidium sp. AG-I]|nr:hypothetical protein BDV93DRAFT_511277 [Ceratobasidium sp. AG-I]
MYGGTPIIPLIPRLKRVTRKTNLRKQPDRPRNIFGPNTTRLNLTEPQWTWDTIPLRHTLVAQYSLGKQLLHTKHTQSMLIVPPPVGNLGLTICSTRCPLEYSKLRCTDSSARHPYEPHPGVDPRVLRLCNPGAHPSRLLTRGNIRAATRVIHFTP